VQRAVQHLQPVPHRARLRQQRNLPLSAPKQTYKRFAKPVGVTPRTSDGRTMCPRVLKVTNAGVAPSSKCGRFRRWNVNVQPRGAAQPRAAGATPPWFRFANARRRIPLSLLVPFALSLP
jgi:hypothetical protein